MGGMNFFVRAVGFFNDSYDLFVMNIVNVVLRNQYPNQYSDSFSSIISMGVFIGSVLGQLVFGYYADRIGRRTNMIATVVLLIAGGLLCTTAYGGAITTTFWLLAIYRFVLGIGIGGEYPLSSTSTAESTDSTSRGKDVALTFSMQGVGQFAACFAGNVLVQGFANPKEDGEYDKNNLEIIWRALFAIGTIPSLLILYPRFQAEESKHFVNRVTHGFEEASFFTQIRFIVKHYGKRLVGTAGTWFLFDIVFYAMGIFSATIVGKDRTLLQTTFFSLLLSLGALPGYFVAAYTVDRIGRRNMQLQGFFFMALIFATLGLFYESIKDNVALYITLYALTFFFANFGPNTTTFILPVESYPTSLRATCHGFSAAMGKVGATLGTALFSTIHNWGGESYVFCGCALICVVSIPVTLLFIEDRVGDLSLLDVELQEFLEQEDSFTRDRLSICYRKSLDIAAIRHTPNKLPDILAVTPSKCNVMFEKLQRV